MPLHAHSIFGRCGSIRLFCRVRFPGTHLKHSRQLNTAHAIEHFLHTFQNSQHTIEARQILEGLDWLTAAKNDKTDGYKAFLQKHPQGKHSLEAVTHIDDADFNVARMQNTIPAHRKYLEEHPSGGHTREARDRIGSLTPVRGTLTFAFTPFGVTMQSFWLEVAPRKRIYVWARAAELKSLFKKGPDRGITLQLPALVDVYGKQDKNGDIEAGLIEYVADSK